MFTKFHVFPHFAESKGWIKTGKKRIDKAAENMQKLRHRIKKYMPNKTTVCIRHKTRLKIRGNWGFL